ncbi:MAG TPA: flagellar biosynthetic protein FliR, partial [Rhodocyclaceae bacterium]|nr:flagellar biosynthetic protein FliR [Rhodocyclaceae bacterium]
MTIEFSSTVLLAALLLATRLAPVFLFAPPLSSVPIPGSARILIVLALSFSLVPLVPATALHFEGIGPFGLIGMFVTEAMSGAFIAFGLLGAFSAVSLAGRLLDLQIGFGVANLFDPITNQQGPMIGSALAMLAAAFFFATDSHLLLFRLMAESASIFPPGHAIAGPADGMWAARQFGYMFFAGVALAFPILLVLLLIDVGLALVSRSVPQLG